MPPSAIDVRNKDAQCSRSSLAKLLGVKNPRSTVDEKDMWIMNFKFDRPSLFDDAGEDRAALEITLNLPTGMRAAACRCVIVSDRERERERGEESVCARLGECVTDSERERECV